MTHYPIQLPFFDDKEVILQDNPLILNLYIFYSSLQFQTILPLTRVARYTAGELLLNVPMSASVGRTLKFEHSKPPSGRASHRIHVRLFRIAQANAGGELIDSIPDDCVVHVGGVEVVNGMPVSFILGWV